MQDISTHDDHSQLTDEALQMQIKEISNRIIEITDSPTSGMAEMEIGRDPDSNATEGEFEQGQFIPGEVQTLQTLRANLRELELERDKRHSAVS